MDYRKEMDMNRGVVAMVFFCCGRLGQTSRPGDNGGAGGGGAVR